MRLHCVTTTEVSGWPSAGGAFFSTGTSVLCATDITCTASVSIAAAVGAAAAVDVAAAEAGAEAAVLAAFRGVLAQPCINDIAIKAATSVVGRCIKGDLWPHLSGIP